MAAGGDYDGGNTTGFVSPAGDALEGVVDLVKEILDLGRPSRYPVRVWGDALRERGILPGDILIADADEPPLSGRVCVAFVHGEVVVATLAYRQGEWWLRPADEGQEAVSIQGAAAEVWAVVCGLVRAGAEGRVARRARHLRPDRRKLVLLLLRARVLAAAGRPGGGGAEQQRRLL